MNLIRSVVVLFAVFLCAQLVAQPKYEFRAVWVATVENIDYPSKRTLTTEEQKKEFIRVLDMHRQNGLNAVIVQIRPAGDAFYPSQFEPWSEYLTGKQGQQPSTLYDPLQFMIDEAHKRGMEFHAWLNPYRAVFNVTRSSVAESHITRKHPEWFVTYGTTKYFNPGEPAVIGFVETVVKDIVERYDVDGIHMDDYFYPYKIPGKEFPDNSTYARYGRGMNKADWRRSNCDSIIRHIGQVIAQTNGRVKFGISPFGVWRNKSQDPIGSNTRAGMNNYDDLYADILLWLKNGWIDYVVPQLYWETTHALCPFETLAQWWSDYSFGRHVYLGHGIYRAGSNATWRNRNEIPRQITIGREQQFVKGSVFYSSKVFERNPNGWNDSLRVNYYKYPALIAPMPWIDSIAPPSPIIIEAKSGEEKLAGQFINLEGLVNDSTDQEVSKIVAYYSNDITTLGMHPMLIVPSVKQTGFSLKILLNAEMAGWKDLYITLSNIDRENNESMLSNIVHFALAEGKWIKAE
jgi:uncharacterized lipoprotein YddW (UPF0748 family)